ncbi:MAG: hypothetical protein ACTSRW_00155 [Candidatus Helarchaeota archaeon]
MSTNTAPRKIPEEISLNGDESIELTYSRNLTSYILTRIIPGIFFVLLLFIILNFIMSLFFFTLITYSGFSIILYLQVTFVINVTLLSIFFPIILLAIIFARAYCNSHIYIVTNKRIIIFRKFIIITRRDVWFDRISDLLVIQGPVGRWKKYGEIQPLTPGLEVGMAQVLHSFLGISSPYESKKEIIKIIQKYRKE